MIPQQKLQRRLLSSQTVDDPITGMKVKALNDEFGSHLLLSPPFDPSFHCFSSRCPSFLPRHFPHRLGNRRHVPSVPALFGPSSSSSSSSCEPCSISLTASSSSTTNSPSSSLNDWGYHPCVLEKGCFSSYVGLKNQGATCYMNATLQQVMIRMRMNE